jgi:hypothetical protein
VLRVLPVLVVLVLVVYCLVDLAQSPADEVRALPRSVWALAILFLPVLGAIGWLLLGRPGGPAASPTAPGASGARPVAPDDDPVFLARLKELKLRAESERLRQWEADLERRERELGRGDDRGDQSRPDPGPPTT